MKKEIVTYSAPVMMSITLLENEAIAANSGSLGGYGEDDFNWDDE